MIGKYPYKYLTWQGMCAVDNHNLALHNSLFKYFTPRASLIQYTWQPPCRLPPTPPPQTDTGRIEDYKQ